MERVLPSGASRSVRTLLAVALLTLQACATAPSARVPRPPSLASSIDELTSRPPFHRAFWSILIEEDDGRVLYSRNAGKLTIPASNRKLYSSVTIANCLGLDTRLATEIWRDGDAIIIRGDGDPSLGSWRYERTEDFVAVAEMLRARGITRVGDIIADVSAFDRITIPYGWKYGNLVSDYAAPVDAIAWGENELPNDRAVDNAALHALGAFRDALFSRGVEVGGAMVVNIEPRVWEERLYVLPSPFVGELLATVLQNSHNLYAEMLFKRSSNGTYEGSFALERAFLTAAPSLDGGAFRFADGSGLAPDNLLTPEANIRLLRWMNDPARRGYWWSVLAQPANNGTLRRRLVALEERVRGKTGTLNGVNALSGVIAMPDGRFRYFAAIVNHHTGASREAEAILDAIVALVADPRSGDADDLVDRRDDLQ